MLYRQVLIFTALACIASVQSFQLPVKALNGSRNDLTRISRKSVTLHERKSKTEPVDDADPEKTVIPLLPAVGASSHPKASTQDLGNPAVVQIPNDETDERSQSTAVVSSKFSLQYTCNVCDTRNSHLVSRMGEFFESTRSQFSFSISNCSLCSIPRGIGHYYLQGVREQALDCGQLGW